MKQATSYGLAAVEQFRVEFASPKSALNTLEVATHSILKVARDLAILAGLAGQPDKARHLNELAVLWQNEFELLSERESELLRTLRPLVADQVAFRQRLTNEIQFNRARLKLRSIGTLNFA